MDAQTQQLAHKVGIFLAAGLVAVSMVFILLVAFLQGDGHALAVANELEPYVLTTMGSLLGLLGVNTIASAVVTIKQSSAATQVAQAAPAVAPAAIAAITQSAPASQPAPVVPVVPVGQTPADVILGS